jgi:dynein heavy chain 1
MNTCPIELMGKNIQVNSNTGNYFINVGIFITMNPDYLGRVELPSNLRKLFRSVSMVLYCNQKSIPDIDLIAQVMLFSRGFKHAEHLALKTIPFFQICKEQLSNLRHYDFGLRSLKNVLISAGILKREFLLNVCQNSDVDTNTEIQIEEDILVNSIRSTLFPKLVKEDEEKAERYLLLYIVVLF